MTDVLDADMSDSGAAIPTGGEPTTSIDALIEDASRFLQATDDAAREDIFFSWTQPPRLDALAGLWRTEYGKTISSLAAFAKVRGYAARVRDLRSSLKELAARGEMFSRALVEAASGGNESRLLTKWLDLPDYAPKGLSLPLGWTIDERGIWLRRDGTEARVSHRPVIVTSKDVDAVSGETRMTIAWRSATYGWRSDTVPRQVLMDSRSIVKLSNYDVPVSSDNSLDMVKWFAEFESANSNLLGSAVVTSRLGWHTSSGNRVFVLPQRTIGESAIRFTPPAGGMSKLTSAVATAGAWQGWCDAVTPILDHPYIMLAIYAACAAPLLEVVDCPSFTVDWSAESSCGKSVAVLVGASVWGYPSFESGGLGRAWIDTLVHVEEMSSALYSLPIILDESQLVKQPKHVADTVYAFSLGSGKGRGAAQGGTRSSGGWRSVLLSTGEQPLVGFTEHGGTRARVITLRARPLGRESDEARVRGIIVKAEIKKHHGHLGPLVAGYLVDQVREDDGEKLKTVWRETSTAYAKVFSSAISGRLADYMAALHVAAAMAHALGLPEATCDPFDELIRQGMRAGYEADRARLAFTDFLSWCSSHQYRFYGRQQMRNAPFDGWAGIWRGGGDWEEIGVRPPIVREVLEGMGYVPGETIERWKTRGYLKTREKGDRWLRTVDGAPTQLFIIERAQAVEAMSDDLDTIRAFSG